MVPVCGVGGRAEGTDAQLQQRRLLKVYQLMLVDE
jgi:hypothetical protein